MLIWGVNLLFLACFSLVFGLAPAYITTTQFLRDSQELVSNNSNFKFGFFSPANSTNRYAGIWYNKKETDILEVIWIANRDNPLDDSSGVLRISEDGNIQLLNGQNITVWSSNVTANSELNDPVAQLLDTGNLVLLSSSSGNIIWQSFDHLTDALLPLMQLSFDENTNMRRQLVSWKSASDPSRGRFTVGINRSTLSEGFIWDGHNPYWRSGPWNGHLFLGITVMYYQLEMDGFRLDNDQHGRLSLSFSSADESYGEHYVLTFDGRLIQKVWDDSKEDWIVVWQSLESECDIYGKCGEYGSCNSSNSRICRCLRGFVPKNDQEWSERNWSRGCVRRTPLQCGIVGGKEDRFLRFSNVKVPDNSEYLQSHDEEHCRRQCLGNCSCIAYAHYVGIGCMIWSGSLIDIQEFSSIGVDLFIRLADADPELDESRERHESSSRLKTILAVSLTLGSLTFAVVMCCIWRRRRGWNQVTSKDRSSVNITDVKLQDIPLLKFDELAAATNNFDDCNKLGQGGFGPVFKGKLEGKEFAVKRLSRASGQGLQEFMNEVDVISKLQRRNLVRLLGCCAEGEEKLLVYEYMPNKSLDALLFDPQLRKVLDWKKRLNVIGGICRGLLYLHRDSRLKIVHRDLKASNILLDENLNAKISDFGMARIFGGNEEQGNTKRVAGTYGYMSPEYAMEGRFSEKSDVYSFGVLLLEIVSGRKNTSLIGDESLSLIKYAWKMRNEGDILSLIDPTINDPCFHEEVLKCIELGLLCVQEFPEERPSISTIISVLDCEITQLPQPMESVFMQNEHFYPKRSPQNYDEEYGSVNNVSITSFISGR